MENGDLLLLKHKSLHYYGHPIEHIKKPLGIWENSEPTEDIGSIPHSPREWNWGPVGRRGSSFNQNQLQFSVISLSILFKISLKDTGERQGHFVEKVDTPSFWTDIEGLI